MRSATATMADPRGETSVQRRPIGKERFRIGRVVALYAVVAALWILFSDLALERFWPDSESSLEVSILKGLAFIAVTAGLLALYLRRERDRAFRTTARHVATTAALLVHFRALASSVSDVVLLADESGRIVEANDAAIAMLGWSRPDLLDRNISEIEIEIGSQASRQPTSYEGTFRTADGRMLPVEVDVLALKVGSRSLRQLVARPVSTREVTGTDHRDRSWVDVFFDMPFIGMAIIEPETKRWVRFNARLCEILGYSREELSERTWTELTHPTDLDREATEFERLLQGRSEGYRLEKCFVSKDGSIIHTEVDMRCRRSPDGKLDYFVATVQDVSERILAAERLRRQKNLYAALSRVNSAITRLPQRDEIFQEVCEAVAGIGRFRFAAISSGGLQLSDHCIEAQSGYDGGFIRGLLEAGLQDEELAKTAHARARRSGQVVIMDPYQDCCELEPLHSIAAAAGVAALAAFPIREQDRVSAVLLVFSAEAGAFDQDSVKLIEEMARDASFALDNRRREEARRNHLQALESSEARYRMLFDANPQPLWVYDLETLAFLEVNDAAVEHYGYSREEFLTMTLLDVRPVEDIPRLMENLVEAKQFRGIEHAGIWRHRLKDRRIIDVQITSHQIEFEGRPADLVLVHDVTEQLRAQQQLRQSEERFRLAVEEAPFPVMIHAEDGEVLDLSRAWSAISGYGIDELPTIEAWMAQAYGANQAEALGSISGSYSLPRRMHAGEFQIRCKDGSERCWEFSSVALPAMPDGRRTAMTMAADVTDHKAALDALQLQSRRMELAHASARIGSWDYDIPTRTLHLHRNAPALLGFDPEPRSLTIKEFVQLVHPDERAQFVEWVNHLPAHGRDQLSRIRMVWPDGSVHWIEHRGDLHFDDAGQPARAFGINTDITERVEAEQRIQNYIGQLERSMRGTVDAISHMVDLRDPYTAGHEARVGQLASAIGRELGLEDSACRGLEIIGRLHDVGKITVPAEILSKPGRLSEIEMNVVRVHAEQGFLILRDIEFDWPVAEAIRQHHERLDGSGYPRGLKGDEIILEARIIAVADVVESMASHRPYRASLGIDAALAEIEGQAGVLYDVETVYACLRLFREQGFSWP